MWFIHLFGRIHSTICLRVQTGNELMLCQPEAQVLEPKSVTLFCLNCLLRQPLTYDTFWRTFYAVRTTRSRFRNDEV